MAELRLPPATTGDSPISFDQADERVRLEYEITPPPPARSSTVAHPPIPRHKLPNSPQILDFIPADTRRRLKDLVLRSHNPRKTLELFRSRTPRDLSGVSRMSHLPGLFPHPLPLWFLR
jgi:hypothetical protein